MNKRFSLFLIFALLTGNVAAQRSFAYIPRVNTLDEMITFAVKQQRKPYRIGAEGPLAFDCSGFTRYCFKEAGIELSRTSQGQASNGKKVRKRKLKTGDLVFFKGSSGRDINHVGIVVKKTGKKEFLFIHASTSAGVIVESSETEYFKSRYKTARRITTDKEIGKEIKRIEKEKKDLAKQQKQAKKEQEKRAKELAKEEKRKEKKRQEELKNEIPESMASPTPEAPTITETSYTVQQGDTLYNISKRAGCSVEEIKEWNQLNDNTISIGQTLILKK
jgi:LysM repeat protein